MKEKIAKGCFFASLIFLAFAYGLFAGTFRHFPHDEMKEIGRDVEGLYTYWKNDFGIEPTRHLMPATKKGAGVKVRNESQMAAGLTLIAGLFGDQLGARLIRPDGEVIRQWDINHTEIWKNSKSATDWNADFQGIVATQDGAIIFNFDTGQSLVKLDRCGDIEWKLKQPFHHALYQSPDGTLWSPWGHAAANVTTDGEILSKASATLALTRSRLFGALYIHRPLHAQTHPNDAEVLSAEMAASFPMFDEGDVLYSMRDINLIFVFDPETKQVKWFQHGPWLRQHDPDFMADGRISVFNNNREEYGGSNIMAVDPASGEVEILYEGKKRDPFYTRVRGKHQHLANGNILIASPDQGRAFEVTRSGKKVWEYINRYDDDRVGFLMNAIRYPPDYFTVDDWSCPDEDEAIADAR